MLVIVKENYDAMSKEAAKLVADRLRKKPNLVLGLATGSTPLGLYRELIRMHRDEGLDFSKVTTFSLDEYVGLPPSHDQSYHYFMHENFFKDINLDVRHIHVPQGMANKTGEADAVKAAVEGPLTAMCPASIIQMHAKAFVFVDRDAASKLTGNYNDSWESKIFQ